MCKLGVPLAGLLLSLAVNMAGGLRCYRCDHNEVRANNNFMLQFLLQQLSKISNPECKLLSRNDRYKVDVVTCPHVIDSGTRYVCGTVRGTVGAKWNDYDFDYVTLARDCVQVPSGDPAYVNTCRETSSMSGPVEYLVEETLSSISDFDLDAKVRFKGRTCYDDSVGIPEVSRELDCATCSNNQLMSVNSLLGPLLEVFRLKNVEGCGLTNADDIYNVGHRVCRPPYAGKVNKCVIIKGEVSGKLFEGLSGGIDFRYTTVSRGCVSVDERGTDVSKYADGCHTEFPPRKSLRDVLTQGYGGLDVEDIQFKGKVCYNDDTFMAKSKLKTEPQEAVTVATTRGPQINGVCRMTSWTGMTSWIGVILGLSLLRLSTIVP